MVGLGNPGTSYQSTRHNVGFWVIDYLADRFVLTFRKKKNYHYARHNLPGSRLFLCKPQTYMNRSGEVFPSVLSVSGLGIERVLVVVDNFDLPPGTLRLKRRGGHPSHNGLRSIDQALGGKEYPRLYLGIGKRTPVRSHVLRRWDIEEDALYHEMFRRACDVVVALLSQPLEAVMETYNKKLTDASS